MKIPTLCAAGAVVLVMTGLCFAQDRDQPQNWENRNAPQYPPLRLPSESPYTLPPLPEEPLQEPRISRNARVFVRQVRVEGATVLRPIELAALVSSYENRELGRTELQALRVALARWYHNQGYANALVTLPDQRVTNGIVVFKVVEGKLGRIEVAGRHKIRTQYIVSRLRRFIKEPLNTADVQYALRYLQQDPNVQRLDAHLAAGELEGEAILRLNLEEQPRFSAGVSQDNHRATSTGANMTAAQFSARDAVGFGEELNATVGHSQGTTVGSAGLSVPFAPRNASVQANYARSVADVIDSRFAQLHITSHFESRSVSMGLPFVDNLRDRLALIAGFESNRSTTYLLGQPFSLFPGAQNGRARTTVAVLALDWVDHGLNEVTGARIAYRRGLDALNATIFDPKTSEQAQENPTGADGRFGLEQAQLIHIERLNRLPGLSWMHDRSEFVVRGTAQISQKPLLALEKLAVGGVNTVRGFAENLFVRDNGVAASAELQLPVPGYRPTAHPLNLVVVPFLDYGRSWDKRNANVGDPNLEDTTTARQLASAGLGLLAQPLRGLDAQFFWGRSIANNFGAFDPRSFRKRDLQDRGIHYSVKYVLSW